MQFASCTRRERLRVWGFGRYPGALPRLRGRCERGDIVPHTLPLSTLCIAPIREDFDRYPSFVPTYYLVFRRPFDGNNTASTANQVS